VRGGRGGAVVDERRGGVDEFDVGGGLLRGGPDEGDGLADVGGEHARAEDEVAQQVGDGLGPGEGDGLGAGDERAGGQVVLEVLADLGQVAHDGHAGV